MIHIEGSWLKDEQGGTLLPCGINLSGSPRVPYHPNGATHIRDQLFSHRDVPPDERMIQWTIHS